MQAPPLVRLKISEPADCDTVAVAVRDELTARIDGARKRQNTLGNRIVARMGEFRRQYHVETSELDDSLASAPGTGSFTRAWWMTTCPGSRINSSGT